MTDNRVRQLTITSMFIALVTVATMLIQIPTPATRGFVNVGDTVIFIAALLRGPAVGAVAGGLGSMLADAFTGYYHWAPWTLVIKAVEGLLMGLLAHRQFRAHAKVSSNTVFSGIVASAWMVFGYYIGGGVMKGFKVALLSIPGNIVQGGMSVLFAVAALYGLQHTGLMKQFMDR